MSSEEKKKRRGHLVYISLAGLDVTLTVRMRPTDSWFIELQKGQLDLLFPVVLEATPHSWRNIKLSQKPASEMIARIVRQLDCSLDSLNDAKK